MRAIDEIGLRKSTRFALYSFLAVTYHWVINHFLYLPQTRKLFLILLGAEIGNDSIIMNVKFFNWHHTGPSGLRIGKMCFLGDETLIDLYDSIILEDQVTIGQRVIILTHTNVGYSSHPLQKYFPKKSRRVIFKNSCFVGAGSIILPGITIGSQSFIAAGSVVTSDVPKNSVYAGVPAKLIRKLK